MGKSQSTFAAFYFRDLTLMSMNTFSIRPMVVAQHMYCTGHIASHSRSGDIHVGSILKVRFELILPLNLFFFFCFKQSTVQRDVQKFTYSPEYLVSILTEHHHLL